MRFSITAILAAPAAIAAADKMIVHTECGGNTCDSRSGRFYTDVGSYLKNASKGCRRTKVPG